MDMVQPSGKPKYTIVKRKRAEPSEEEAVHIATCYANRAHGVVLRRAFESEREKIFQETYNTLRSEWKEWKIKCKSYKSNPQISLNQYMFAKQKVKNLKLQMKQHPSMKCAWIKQCFLLNAGTLSSLVQANRLLHRAPEVFSVDSDRCQKCHIPFKFKHVISRNVCHYCFKLEQCLFYAEDASIDTLIQKAKTSGVDAIAEGDQQQLNGMGTGGTIPLMINNKKTGSKLPPTSSQRAKQLADHLSQYKTFLLQYAENAPVIPNEVLNFITTEMVTIHLGASAECPTTSIKCILSRSSTWSHFVPHVGRIARIYNRKPLPQLSIAQIDILSKRFEHLLRLGTREDYKQKIFVDEVITVVFLLLDHCRLEAEKFLLHKTRAVLEECSWRYMELIALARQENASLWPNVDVRLL